ncbi:AraC family transcriptional regulator [Pandoraea terrae]|uniref:AraC family transcriptional regulator n=2 Tax=Pandoraea terrae TaxID=1537710 RepID=A0A5E4W7W7_9BURK|nr:AraC family transcriptional regulator [Pandoraea terrae]
MVTAEYGDHTFAPHWHDAYTVAVIEAGAERYDYRGTHHVADTGSVPVLNPGEIHTGASATAFGWRYRVFYLPVDFVHSVAASMADRRLPMPWFAEAVVRDPDLTARLRLAHCALQDGIDPLAAELALTDAVTTLLGRYAAERPTPAKLHRDAVRVEAMKARLAADLTEPLALSELAAAVGLSPFHAARLFTRETGLAPHAWRNQLRLTRALPGLRAGLPATDVAMEQGFTDLSHFTRHFRKAFGVSPGRWCGRGVAAD